MANKSFTAPLVVLSAGWGGDGEETGGGSSGSSPDVTMCSYTEWLEMYNLDWDEDGVIDEYDFASWWLDNGFTEEDWDEYAGIPWPL